MRGNALTLRFGVAAVIGSLLCSAYPAIAEVTANTTNLLLNPSFEEDLTGGVGDWMSRAWSGQAQWDIESLGHTGKRCATINSEQGGDAAWTAHVVVEPNFFYKLAGWIKTRNVSGATGALLNIQNMQHVRTSAITGTKDWTEVSTVFRTGAATTLEINCLFGGWGASTGQAWYDDISVQRIDLQEELEATVTIDSETAITRYSPMIFGGFLEHFGHQIYGGVFDPESNLSNEMGFREDVIAALKELKIPIVRWPGGCYVSGYHWQDGVGKTRTPTDDMAWGVVEPHTFGTDEFVTLCRLAGWTPYICNNAGNGTVQEMKAWVQYCNGSQGRFAQMRRDNGHREPWYVPIWSIGNENWGRHEIGYKPIEQWAPLVLKAARAMKAADPNIQLTAAALPTREWTLPLLEQAGPYLDYLSIHGYWLPLWQENQTPDYMTCIMKSQGPEVTIANYVQVLEESGYRGRIKIAFDEWNLRGWHHPGFPRKTVQDYNDPEVIELVAAREKNLIASQYTMADALFAASFFNACLRHAEDIGMANIAPLVNTRGPLYVYPGGIVKRTHFHTMAMYANLLDSHIAHTTVEAGLLTHGDQFIPVVDAIATTDQAKRTWSIALVNRNPKQEVTCKIVIKKVPLHGQYDAVVLAGDSPDAYNDVGHPDRVTPKQIQLIFEKGQGQLPPHSLTIITVPPTSSP